MAIAETKFFSKEHIESARLNASSALAEQAIYCLELVAELASNGLSFQFKGGNSLLLILDQPQRFSIDVDIATNETKERIESCIDEIVLNYGAFIRWDRRQHKTKPWISLASYYLFYRSHYAAPDQAFVMLDAQLSRSPYKTGLHTVSSGAIYQSTAEVELPFPASIIGDKLLTMGPFTLGIPLGKGKESQRLKHVYDVSSLLNTKPKLSDVRESLVACLEHENSLQQKGITIADVADDTVKFCASVMHHECIPDPAGVQDPVLKENAVGLDGFASHLFTKGYAWKNLQADMSRVAFCISAAANSAVSDLEFEHAMNSKEHEPSYYWTFVKQWNGKDPLEKS